MPKSPTTLSFEQLRKFFTYPLQQASSMLGMSQTTLKKHCRNYGIRKWPYRRVASLRSQMSLVKSKLNNCESLSERYSLQGHKDLLERQHEAIFSKEFHSGAIPESQKGLGNELSQGIEDGIPEGNGAYSCKKSSKEKGNLVFHSFVASPSHGEDRNGKYASSVYSCSSQHPPDKESNKGSDLSIDEQVQLPQGNTFYEEEEEGRDSTLCFVASSSGSSHSSSHSIASTSTMATTSAITSVTTTKGCNQVFAEKEGRSNGKSAETRVWNGEVKKHSSYNEETITLPSIRELLGDFMVDPGEFASFSSTSLTSLTSSCLLRTSSSVSPQHSSFPQQLPTFFVEK